MAAGVVKHLFHAGHQRYARSGYRNESGYELDEVIDVSLLGLATLGALPQDDPRSSEEHTSELQSLMRISYAVFCLKKKTTNLDTPAITQRHNVHPTHTK